MKLILIISSLISLLALPNLAKVYKMNVDPKLSDELQEFDGFGAVSGGGATSKLLFTYFPKEKDRRRVLEVMFNKEGGLQMLKVEMGGDDQSTEGSESSHLSEPGSYCKNNYEFRLIREVLNINSEIPICVLPWTFPGWLGSDPYSNVSKTANYVVEWLKIGRDTWNFDTYCVGVWNERNFSESYVRELRRVLNASGFEKTLIVAGEGFRMDDSYDRLLDKEFINEYDIIGVHYPGGQIPQKVQKSGKRVWASEDYSTDNRETGMGCMARNINWNFVNGGITGMLTWHLMSAFYPQLPWYRCGLASIDENKFFTENAFHVLKYVTSHVKRGWKMLPRGKGSGKFEGGGTYVTYTSGKDFTIFVESMSYSNSMCEYSNPRPFSVKKQQKISLNIPKIWKGLNISLNFEPSKFLPKSRFLHHLKFDLPVDSFGVLTTLPLNVPTMITVLTPELPLNYQDDFEDYDEGEEPRFWMPQKGSWTVRDGRAVQKVIRPPISWCTSGIRTPYAVMAYHNKKDKLKTDVKIPVGSNATSIILGLRSNCSGCDIEVTNCRGIFIEVNFSTRKIIVFSDFVNRSEIAKLYVKTRTILGIWYRMSIELTDEHKLLVNFESEMMMLDVPEDVIGKTKHDNLFLIGTGNFGFSEWDNMVIDF